MRDVVRMLGELRHGDPQHRPVADDEVVVQTAPAGELARGMDRFAREPFQDAAVVGQLQRVAQQGLLRPEVPEQGDLVHARFARDPAGGRSTGAGSAVHPHCCLQQLLASIHCPTVSDRPADVQALACTVVVRVGAEALGVRPSLSDNGGRTASAPEGQAVPTPVMGPVGMSISGRLLGV